MRLCQIDALRGIAACIVAFGFHAVAVGGPALPWLSTYGWTCVDLFFVISGAVFSHIYLASGRLQGGLAAFTRARVARLYPLHLLTLCIVAALFAWGQPVANFGASYFALNLAMLQGFAAESYNYPAWSITVECLCYAIFALSAAAGRPRAAALAALAIGLVLAASPERIIYRVGRGLVGFFFAVLIWPYRDRIAAPAWFLGSLALIFLATGFRLPFISYGASLSLTAWPLLLFAALKVDWLAGQPWKWLGERSYSIYLWHVPAGLIAGAWAPMIALTLALSHFSYRYFESPARLLITRRQILTDRLGPKIGIRRQNVDARVRAE